MWRDFRYALRLLGKYPAFSLAATLVFALGIGLTTSMFSVVDVVLLRPLPYPEPDRLVAVTTYFPSIDAEYVASPEYLDWSNRNRVFDDFAAVGHSPRLVPLQLRDAPVQVR